MAIIKYRYTKDTSSRDRRKEPAKRTTRKTKTFEVHFTFHKLADEHAIVLTRFWPMSRIILHGQPIFISSTKMKAKLQALNAQVANNLQRLSLFYLLRNSPAYRSSGLLNLVSYHKHADEPLPKCMSCRIRQFQCSVYKVEFFLQV